MNATSRTLAFAGVALVSALAAVGAWFGSRPVSIEGYADVGQAFFPEFNNPLTATALSIGKYNDKAKEFQAFAVRQNDNGAWVIPSHHDYPAEAQERLARTAASMIGVKKDAVQSRSKEDWKNYGVVDPAADGAATVEERGTRVTLKDASGNPLVDLIIGKKVEGREKHYYVREPDKNTTYIAEVDSNLSAKFSDWIEPDLLKVSQNELVSLTVDNYSVDEVQGAIVPAEKLVFRKDDFKSSNPWKLDGTDDTLEKLDEGPVREIARNVDQLKIVGVRPKPAGLNADLTVSPEVARNPLLREVLQSDMQRQGFYIASGPNNTVRLVSNEGELLAGADNGVQYTLFFGEIARGSDKDIEVGFANADKTEEAAKEGDAAADAAKSENDEAGGPRRYLLVKVDFDESLLGPAPVEPTPPVKPAILDSDPAGNGNEAPPAATPPEKKETPADLPKTDSPTPEPEDKKDAESSAPEKSTDSTPDPSTDDAPPKPDPAPEPASETPKEEGSCGLQDEPAPVTNSKTDESPAPAADPAAPVAETSSAEDPKPADPPAADKPADAAPTPEPAAQEKPATEQKPADSEKPPVSEKPADDPAAPAPAAATPPVDPKQAAQAEYDRAKGEYEATKAAYDRDVKARTEKIETGRKKATELSARFSKWYYVITADSFEKFRITRKDVISLKADDAGKPGADATPGGGFGLPEGSGFPGFPGGLPQP